MSNLSKIIKTAEHFKEIHSEEISSVGFNTIIQMLKKIDISNTYSLSSLKKECKQIIKNYGLDENVDYISLEVDSSSFGNRYKLSVTGLNIYIRECKTAQSLLKKLDQELKENKTNILEEIAKKKEAGDIALK